MVSINEYGCKSSCKFLYNFYILELQRTVEKVLKYAENMIPLFFAILKFVVQSICLIFIFL